MAGPNVEPFRDDHLDAAAELLAARHRRHREAEPLLPEGGDFRAHIEREWRADGASGVLASQGREPVAYLIARPMPYGGDGTWMLAGIAGHAVSGDAELARDVYAAAAAMWVAAGHTRHGVYIPTTEPELIDRWFHLSFGASGVLATRETEPQAPFGAEGVTVRPGTPDDLDASARLDRAMTESMLPSPSFSTLEPESHDELLKEWADTWDDEQFVHFVAELEGRVAGSLLLYKRPADLRVPEASIDLAHVSTDPAARGAGIGRAMTAHAISWAHEAGYPCLVTDWRTTNMLASRFWPRRGFRTTFIRLYRSLP
jgi:ribosomal protein S18 acetylase RimI-like enzyme